ncbi:MAG TPA: YqeG family HAD IIIA-type phosphatase [Clostridiales bacterium]|nr:YqeG family HAD IIIA-type phosphatase [Clostridiales bacterium]
MLEKFRPSLFVDRASSLQADRMKSLGIRGLILDIDNTIAQSGRSRPEPWLQDWLAEIRQAGIQTSIVSNSGAKRSARFGELLGMPAFARAGKPSVRRLLEAAACMGTPPENTAVIGDQIFTDIWGANRAGMKSIRVKPVRPWREPVQVMFKRLLEWPLCLYFRSRGKTGGKGEDLY